MLKQLGQPVTEVIGNKELLKKVAANDVIQKLVDDKFGVVTIKDILIELEKPGRDPRPEFKTATFEDGVEDINQLIPGMILEGVVTNVAAFGAFIDIGVHQDGLVHVSALADKFVKDPHEVVKAGQVVKVKVLEVDVVASSEQRGVGVFSGDGVVGTGDGAVLLRRVQPEGKPAMAADAWLRGRSASTTHQFT